jgi:hypothetical protein
MERHEQKAIFPAAAANSLAGAVFCVRAGVLCSYAISLACRKNTLIFLIPPHLLFYIRP